MTEDEAKMKWCPFVRHDNGTGAFNRGAWGGPKSENYDPINIKNNEGKFACNCIGSVCMAWRWQMTVNKDGSIEDEKEGFCGLAGEP